MPATRYSWAESPVEAAAWASRPWGGVERRVRCNGCLRTPPGSEDSNGKLDVPCAVGSPDGSLNRGARAGVVCRIGVHDQTGLEWWSHGGMGAQDSNTSLLQSSISI